MQLDTAISCVAGRQHGVVTWHQLRALGMSRTEIDGRFESGSLHRLHRGVYLWGNPSPAPFASDLAAVLSCGEAAYLTAASACAGYGLIKAVPLKREILLVGRQLHRKDIATRSTATLHSDDHRIWHAIPIVSPSRAVIDYARDATPDQVADAIEQGQIKGLITKAALQAAVDRAGKRPGIPFIRDLLTDLVFTRSKAERIVLDLIRQAGLPLPRVNHRLDGDEIDFVWDHLGIVVEVDGYRFHSTRRRVENDRRRDADHQLNGYTTLRATYTEITTRPYYVIPRLATAIARAADAQRARKAAA